MNFSKVQRDTKPPRHVVLPPSSFGDEWPNKPATEACIGLRFISQADFDAARREAEREARGFYAEFRQRDKDCDNAVLEDVYNDSFLAHIAARGTCNPNDVTQPYFPFAEDTVRQALTPEAMRRVWDEIVILHKGSAPSRPEASDEDVAQLAWALRRAELDSEGRRLCAYLLEKIGPVVGAPEKDEEDGAYYVTAEEPVSDSA